MNKNNNQKRITTYKNKAILNKIYRKYGSTWRAGKYFGVTNTTILNWMRRFKIPRIPKMYLYNNNSGKGRINELYILGHPFFKRNMKDLGIFDDKSKSDVLWYGDKTNIKCTHSKWFMFRIKKRRHDVCWYICCVYIDDIDSLIPVEIFVIPANVAPHTGITVSLTKADGKYAKYKLSLKRNIEFSSEEEKKYNQKFKNKYSKYLKMSGGEKNEK